MTFQDLQGKHVFQAVFIIVGIGFFLFFAVLMAYVLVMSVEVFSDLDPNLSTEEQQTVINEKFLEKAEDLQNNPSSINTLMIIPLSLMAAITFFISRRTTRHNAVSSEQAIGYGVAIGTGVVVLFGVCVCISSAFPINLIFLGLIFGAAVIGGQAGERNRDHQPKRIPTGQPVGSDSLSSLDIDDMSLRSSSDTYYNMGIVAALGERKEEARQHFTRVLQLQPRHVAAWLQLANLADTPAQAWNYIQQARSIDPVDPDVMSAVDIIWPQVVAQAEQGPPPHNQPPYLGGAQDDPVIPKTTLPGSAAPAVPPTEDEDVDPDTPL